MALPQFFFFYGTLIAGSDNAAARGVHGRLRSIGAASVHGALWAVPDAAGWYPALVAGQGWRVQGMLYAATDAFGADDLSRLDDWEDYLPDRPAESLYLRETMPVIDAGGASLAGQVYRFNQALPTAACAILNGDFRAWLKATGHNAYSG